MKKTRLTKIAFLFVALPLLLIGPAVNSAWGCVQFCEEPYCNNQPMNSINFVQTSNQVIKPTGLDNPALLNLESDPPGPETPFQAAFQINSSGVTQIGGTAVDANGNYYVTGGFTGTMMCPDCNAVLTSSKGYDFFLAKIDPNGTCLWVRMARGNTSLADNLSLDGGLALAVDRDGHCYVGGAFVKSLSFLDPNGNPVAELTDGRGEDNRINFEMFIAKYDASGSLLWARGGQSDSVGDVNSLGATELNVVNTIILDGEDYPYIGGSYSGTDFLGEAVQPKGKADFFVAALEKTGELDWVKTGGTPDFDGTMSLSIDSYGYINMLGYVGQGTVVLPDFNEPDPYVNDKGVFDTGILGLDVNGDSYFAMLIGADVNVRGRDIATDPLGDIFVTGDFEGTANFVGSDLTLTAEGNDWNGYLVKYDLNGYALWARRMSGPARVQGSRVVVDAVGNSYVLGVFYSQVLLGEESDHPVTLVANGQSDMFIAKYDPNGTFQWAKQIDGSGTEGLDQINSPLVHVATNPTQLLYDNGSLILSGDFNGQLVLDTGITLESSQNTRAGFMARFDLPTDSNAVSGDTTSHEPNDVNNM